MEKIAPTKFAKCFMKQEGVDHDTKRARSIACLVQTYNSSKKEQEAATLCIITSGTFAAVVVSYVS